MQAQVAIVGSASSRGSSLDSMNPKTETLNPKHPKPETRNPKPQTLNPKAGVLGHFRVSGDGIWTEDFRREGPSYFILLMI